MARNLAVPRGLNSREFNAVRIVNNSTLTIQDDNTELFWVLASHTTTRGQTRAKTRAPNAFHQAAIDEF